MKKEEKIWKKIHEPKIEELIIRFNQNGKPEYIMEIIDPKDIPKITRERKKNKK
ncbi:MAG: hypothetical protein ABSA79_07360 [Candidatus Bathyarchaeia archaeon]|jgi:hypothetical protein